MSTPARAAVAGNEKEVKLNIEKLRRLQAPKDEVFKRLVKKVKDAQLNTPATPPQRELFRRVLKGEEAQPTP